MFEVGHIFLAVEKNLLLLKCTGLLLAISVALYLIIKKTWISDSNLTWKKVIGLSVGMSVVNAGIVLIFGKAAFFTTPLILALMLVLWFASKFPVRWEGKHIIALGSVFAISSVSIFFGVTFIFFHLAIEGRM